MKIEDTKIYYRPELSEKLRISLESALKFYNINFKKFYYSTLAVLYENKDVELSMFLKEVAKCFDDNLFGTELFYEKYEDLLVGKFHMESVSEARAAYCLFEVYGSVFDKERDSINMDGFTKFEKYMVESFFNKLKAPMRNPNIEIKDGQTKCYYDRNRQANFRKDLELSLDFVKKECQATIDLFNIPD